MRKGVWRSIVLPTLALTLGSAAATPPVELPVSPDLCGTARGMGDPGFSELCRDVEYLGFGTFAELGLIPSGWSFLPAIKAGAEGREELASARHFFAHDVFVVSVRSDSAHHLDMVLRTAAAIDSIKASRGNAYRFITSMTAFPTAPALPTSMWKNRLERIIISFDKTPDAIAASATLLGPFSDDKGLKLNGNYGLISIDEVTIRGATEQLGSRRIYRKASAEENYRAYMADGLIFSLVHEAAHLHVGHVNSASRLANTVYFARGSDGTDPEEVVANETAMSFVGFGLSPEMRRSVMDENTDLTNKPGVRGRLGQWNTIAGSSRSYLVVPD